MAIISNGATINLGGGNIPATDIQVNETLTAVDATALGDLVSFAVAGRPIITGSATVHMDNGPSLTLAQKFCGGNPNTAAVTVTITPGGPNGGVGFSGSAIITGFSTSLANDAIQTATVTWQYTDEITASRS